MSMMRTAAAMTVLCAALCHASGPRLSIAQREQDLGLFPADSVQTCTFVLRNTGLDTLQIYRVHTSCGCTRHSLAERRIAPGDSAMLTVRYDGAGRRPGSIRQTVRIRSNDDSSPYINCYIKGRIRRPAHK